MKRVLQKPAGQSESRGLLDPKGFEQHVHFQTWLPPDDLKPFVEHFWKLRWDQTDDVYYSEQVMHRPHVDVFLSAQESGIQGTFRDTRIYVAQGIGTIIGIRFRPGAFHTFYPFPMETLHDQNINLRLVFPQADQPFIHHVLACDDDTAIDGLIQLLREKRIAPDSNVDLINAVITAIELDETLQTVAAVAQKFNRSERSIQQLFQDYVGIGLKWLLKRRRLLRAAQHIRDTNQPDWADIAYLVGYSSQQHFIADFKKVIGKTPVQYKQNLTTLRPAHQRDPDENQ